MFNVTDANDNRPIFVIPSGGYVANVLENSTVGSEVITVMATDLDQGIHQSITYSVLSNATTGTSVPFEITDPTVSTCTHCSSQHNLPARHSYNNTVETVHLHVHVCTKNLQILIFQKLLLLLLFQFSYRCVCKQLQKL